MAKTRAFISFAKEDERSRDLFIGQGKLDATPWEVADWSVYEAFSEEWKTKMRARIKRTEVLIQLVSKNTLNASGAIWEVNCAKQEGIPVFGVWIYKDDRSVPSCFTASQIIPWTWEGVAAQIKKATGK